MGTKVAKSIKSILNSLIEIIYPYEEQCIFCGEEGFVGVCCRCNSKIKRVNEGEEILSYGYYSGVLKHLILAFKYEKNFTAGKILSKYIVELINEEGIRPDIICYVPMTKKAEKKRGFNQCKLIANNISNILDIPVCHELKKIKNTNEQKRLLKSERASNVKDAFELKGKVSLNDKNVILIDDVTTTGATLMECKKILNKNNLKSIKVLTIAKSNI